MATERTWKIYKITGPNGSYVGLTIGSIKRRWQAHIRGAEKGVSLLLHRAIRKYGADVFTVSLLTECFSLKEAQVCERALIALHRTFCKCGGYNLSLGGEARFGCEPTRKQLESLASWARSLQNRERMRTHAQLRKGHHWSAEVKEKMSIANKGKRRSKETITRIQQAVALREANMTPEALAARKAHGRRGAEARWGKKQEILQ